MKHVEENLRANLHGFRLANGFLAIASKKRDITCTSSELKAFVF